MAGERASCRAMWSRENREGINQPAEEGKWGGAEGGRQIERGGTFGSKERKWKKKSDDRRCGCSTAPTDPAFQLFSLPNMNIDSNNRGLKLHTYVCSFNLISAHCSAQAAAEGQKK